MVDILMPMSANQSTTLSERAVSAETLHSPHTLQTLQTAADSFVKHTNGTTEIWAASRDWFLEEWGRDTFISLPGLLLATRCFDDAKQVFVHFAEHEQNGLIPNVIRGEYPSYNTVDASLWFIHALKAYREAKQNWSLVAELMPVVRNIIVGYTNGTSFEHAGSQHRIAMDTSDGLITSPAQATWMDADPVGDGTTIVTPRNGKCVEINALWYGALRFAIAAEKQLNPDATTADLEQRAELVRSSYANKFWNHEAGCLFDVIEGDPHSGAVRPNQLIALSHGLDLLTPDRKQQVLEAVKHDLLTPGGLRTLSPRDSHYIGHYDTSAPIPVKDLAYHQGTVWPWLIGPYCDAVRIVRAEQGVGNVQIQQEVATAIGPLVQFCLQSEYHSIPEVFSGDPPYEPGGTASQAWSVAEVLRTLTKLFEK